ncbi:MAG: PIN domain-containing protein, partial [Deltaproteobacteria bacterium]|nr:PIN domain-containing protein [Deltaproteobacteria bacterium]
MARYVLDANVYIAADRDPSFAEELDRFTSAYLPSIHLHGVVAQELLAGAIDRRREALVEESLVLPFERRGRLITPSFRAWKSAGRIMTQLVQRKLMSPGGFKRSFPNDCVLAASCREAGLTLITLNREDFDLIRKVHPFEYME